MISNKRKLYIKQLDFVSEVFVFYFPFLTLFLHSLSMGLYIYGQSYEIGKMNENNMECVNKANKILIDTPSTVKTQPQLISKIMLRPAQMYILPNFLLVHIPLPLLS